MNHPFFVFFKFCCCFGSSTNQPTNQPTSHPPTHPPTNQPATHPPTHPPTHQPTHPTPSNQPHLPRSIKALKAALELFGPDAEGEDLSNLARSGEARALHGLASACGRLEDWWWPWRAGGRFGCGRRRWGWSCCFFLGDEIGKGGGC